MHSTSARRANGREPSPLYREAFRVRDETSKVRRSLRLCAVRQESISRNYAKAVKYAADDVANGMKWPLEASLQRTTVCAVLPAEVFPNLRILSIPSAGPAANNANAHGQPAARTISGTT
jgi:hypothetical protein